MVYQFNSDMLPDTYFHPGDLKYVVPGNEGRWLDPRRTPIRILEVKPASGFFIVEILDIEDKGARWEIPLESVDRCQFAPGSATASEADTALYKEIISRLDRPLEIVSILLVMLRRLSRSLQVPDVREAFEFPAVECRAVKFPLSSPQAQILKRRDSNRFQLGRLSADVIHSVGDQQTGQAPRGTSKLLFLSGSASVK